MAGARSQALEKKEATPIKFRNGNPTQKDVKNEDRSGWIIENKGAKKVLWMS